MAGSMRTFVTDGQTDGAGFIGPAVWLGGFKKRKEEKKKDDRKKKRKKAEGMQNYECSNS